jgi:hypothetical protein
MKVWIIGQAPGWRGDPSRPLDAGPIRSRLIELLGCSEQEWSAVGKANLLDRFPGKQRSGKGDRFPLREAKERAGLVGLRLCGGFVFLLGKGVAAAFGLKKARFLERVDLGWFEAIVVPHPSGVSRYWNSTHEAKRAREVVRRAYREAVAQEAGGPRISPRPRA